MSSGYNGYLMLNKEIKRHEYFTEYKTFHLFFWLLSDANFIEGNCNGILVKRGQKLTSLNSLIIETGLTEREVRTALEKLIKGNHIVKKATNKNTLLTVVEYEFYTGSTEAKDKPITRQQQTKGKPTTTIEEFKNTKKEISKEIERVNSDLSHFDFLNLNFKKELLLLVNEYKPKIYEYKRCIEKFNDTNKKHISIIVLKSWFDNWIDNQSKKSNNANSLDQNEIDANHPSRKKIKCF